MNDTNDPQRSFVAKWALALFIFGLLAPLVVILLILVFVVLALAGARPPGGPAEQTALAVGYVAVLALGFVSEVLALILGIVGRRHVAGKIAWIGATALLGFVLIYSGIRWCFSTTEPRMARMPDPAPRGPTTLPPGAAEAIKRQEDAAKSLGITKELVLDVGKGVAMKLVLIPAGTFLMGSPETEKGRQKDEGPQREVTISKPFHMGVYEVTQEQYKAVVGSTPSSFKGKGSPLGKTSWNDAVEFCRKLSAKSGKKVRLPTEAEWEYACRAGTRTRFSFGDKDADLGDYAWHAGNSDDKTHPVGGKKPNGFGLYDMHGNVSEWCSDWYAESYANAKNRDPVGPVGPDSGSLRMLRGGSWRNDPRFCRSAVRLWFNPVNWDVDYGFRVAVVAAAVD